MTDRWRMETEKGGVRYKLYSEHPVSSTYNFGDREYLKGDLKEERAYGQHTEN